MATTSQLLDADRFLARPLGPRGRREELIDGRIVVHEPTVLHQLVSVQIVVALKQWIDEGGRGHVSLPVDLRISERTVLAPDVLWYADHGRIDLHGAAQLQPPDLVVEVRSPSTWAYGAATTLSSPLLPGFELPVSALFALPGNHQK